MYDLQSIKEEKMNTKEKKGGTKTYQIALPENPNEISIRLINLMYDTINKGEVCVLIRSLILGETLETKLPNTILEKNLNKS